MRSLTILLIGVLINSVGTGMTAFGLGVFAYQLQGTATAVALVQLCAFAPIILLAPLAGALADRFDRRLMMAIGDGGSVLGLGVVLAALSSPSPRLEVILAGVTASSCLAALTEPALRASITDLVPAEDHVRSAGLLQAATAARYLVSPFLAGALLPLVGLRALLVMDAATCLVTVTCSVVVMRTLRAAIASGSAAAAGSAEARASAPAEPEGAAGHLLGGWRAVLHHPGLRTIVGLMTVMTLAIGTVQVLLKPILLPHVDAAAMGRVETLAATGILAGAALVTLLSRARPTTLLSAGTAATGAAMVLLSLRSWTWWVALSGFAVFAALSLCQAGAETLVRRSVAADHQARVWGGHQPGDAARLPGRLPQRGRPVRRRPRAAAEAHRGPGAQYRGAPGHRTGPRGRPHGGPGGPGHHRPGPPHPPAPRDPGPRRGHADIPRAAPRGPPPRRDPLRARAAPHPPRGAAHPTGGALMVRRLLRADLATSPVVAVTLAALIALAAALASASTWLIVDTTAATNRLTERARVPDLIQMHAGEADPAAIEAWADGRSEILEHEVITTLPVPRHELWIDGANQADSYYEPAFVTAPSRIDLLLDDHGEPADPGPGEVFLPIHYQAVGMAEVGDTITVESQGWRMDLEVVGFVRDAQMNAPMVPSKRLVVSPQDFSALAERITEPEYLIEFDLADSARPGSVTEAYKAAGLPATGIAIDGSMINLINALSTMLIAAVALVVALVLAVMAILALRYTVLAAIEADLPQIAVLKAIGAPQKRIRRLYALKYTVLALVGSVVGYAAAIPLAGALEAPAVLYLGEPPTTAWSLGLPLAATLSLAGSIIGFTLMTLRRVGRISAVEALRPRRHRWRLSSSRRLPVQLWLGMREAMRPSNALLVGVLTLCTFTMVLPVNVPPPWTTPGSPPTWARARRICASTCAPASRTSGRWRSGSPPTPASRATPRCCAASTPWRPAAGSGSRCSSTSGITRPSP